MSARGAGTLVVLLWIALTPAPARAQTTAASGEPAAGTLQSDSDPTRPVFFSVRPEFYRVADGIEQRALILRYDSAFLATRRIGRGLPGVVVRFEAPLVAADLHREHRGGFGDAYGQFFVMPYARNGFVWAVGSGVILPTATSDVLGTGKLVVAPVVAPLWRFRRGLFLVKLQNFISVGGDSTRANLNYLLVTPLFVHALGARFWILADSETKTDWTDGGRTGVKSGLQIGRAIAPHVGLWVKPEVWWRPNRDGRWNLKFGIVWYQRRSVPESHSETVAQPAF